MSRWLLIAALVVASGCTPGPPDEDGGMLHGVALAGPVCPVVSDPPDPDCADRPVRDARIVVTDPDGREAASVVTDENGRFALAIPTGDYILVPQPVDGLMGTPGPISVTVAADGSDPIVIAYDTGIR